MRTGRWFELSAEHEVRYTGNERFLVITMSRKLEVTNGVVWVGGWGVRSKDQTGVLVSIIT